MQTNNTRQFPSRLRRTANIVGVALAVTLGSHAVLASAQTPAGPAASMPAPGAGPMPGTSPMRGGPGWDSPRGAHQGPWHHGDRLFKKLGLSEKQQTQVRALRKTAFEKSMPLHQQMGALMQQRMKLLAQPTLDRGALEDLRVKQMDLADKLSRIRTENQYAMAEILTPEQRTKAYAMFERRAERGHRHWRGHPGGPGQPGMPGGPGPMQ